MTGSASCTDTSQPSSRPPETNDDASIIVDSQSPNRTRTHTHR